MPDGARTKPLYRIKGIGGEFRASAVIRVAAGSLQMTLERKDNKAIRKWIDEHVENFKWTGNFPAQIDGALKKASNTDGRGKQTGAERNITSERLTAAVILLQRLDTSPRHKAIEAEVATLEKALDALANRNPRSLEAFVSKFGSGEAAAAAIAKVGAYTPFTFPPHGTPDHEEMLWVVELAAEQRDLEKLTKQALAIKPSPVIGFVPKYALLEHAKSALHAIMKLVCGANPDAKADVD